MWKKGGKKKDGEKQRWKMNGWEVGPRYSLQKCENTSNEGKDFKNEDKKWLLTSE